MKYLVPAFWLITTFASPVLSQEPVCSPVFSEIFNFNLGDKFNYLVIEGDATGDGIETYYWHFSYEIIEKEIRQDTSMYVIRGELPPSIAMTRSWPHSWVENYLFDFYPYSNIDTLILIDSTNHYLNACYDSLGMFHLPGLDSIFTVIGNGDEYGYPGYNDTLLLKSTFEYFCYNDTNSLVYDNLYEDIYFEVYVERFGLLTSVITEFEHEYGVLLTSCEMDSLVVVLLEYDDLPVFSDEPMIRIFPNPANDYVQVISEKRDPILNLEIWSLNGVCLRSEDRTCGSETELSLSDLPKGIYYLHIITSQSNFVRRFVID